MHRILKLDETGQPDKWISWEDAVCYHAKNLVYWSSGDNELTLRGGNNRFTGQQSIIRTSSIIAVKGEAKGKRRFRHPSLGNTELFRRDRHLCAYCGNVFPESKLTRDHIVPRSRGGADTWMNVVTACAKCNQHKDDKTLDEAGMQLLYVPYVPTRAEFLILENRAILADQMEFLLAFVPEHSRIRGDVAQ